MDRRWFLAMPLIFAAGCGGFSAGQKDEAKGYVQMALDKWKAGGSPDDLKAQATPIEFYEAWWTDGQKLVSYEIGEVTADNAEQVVRVNVSLTVQKGKAKPRTETAYYDVSFGPPVKVVNNPMP